MSIASMLEGKETSKYRENNNLNIFILEQLIIKKENILLIQQQVRLIRSSKGRSYKPNQFKYLEDKVIEQNITRKIKVEYQIIASNRNIIICKKFKVS